MGKPTHRFRASAAHRAHSGSPAADAVRRHQPALRQPGTSTTAANPVTTIQTHSNFGAGSSDMPSGGDEPVGRGGHSDADGHRHGEPHEPPPAVPPADRGHDDGHGDGLDHQRQPAMHQREVLLPKAPYFQPRCHDVIVNGVVDGWL